MAALLYASYQRYLPYIPLPFSKDNRNQRQLTTLIEAQKTVLRVTGDISLTANILLQNKIPVQYENNQLRLTSDTSIVFTQRSKMLLLELLQDWNLLGVHQRHIGFNIGTQSPIMYKSKGGGGTYH